mgnify:CR=1 FL=1
MKNKIRLGILGGGGDSLIGIVHRIASSMHDSYEIIGGVFNPNFSENVKFAKEIGLSENRIYEDYEKMIEEVSNVLKSGKLNQWNNSAVKEFEKKLFHFFLIIFLHIIIIRIRFT